MKYRKPPFRKGDWITPRRKDGPLIYTKQSGLNLAEVIYCKYSRRNRGHIMEMKILDIDESSTFEKRYGKKGSTVYVGNTDGFMFQKVKKPPKERKKRHKTNKTFIL